MDGIKEFRKFQLGREVKNGGAAGTAVAATALMRGQWIGSDDTPVNYPDENIGMQVDVNRSFIPYVLGSIKQGPDQLTFEQFPYILAAAIRGIERGVADGLGSGYIYHYDWPMMDSDVELSAATISFASATKTIADSANKLAFIKPGDVIRITGAGQAGNNNTFLVVSAAAGAVVVTEALTDEAAGATIKIEVLTQTYTAEGGNNARVDRSPYSFPTSFELSGKGGQNADAILLSSSWTTRQWAKLATGFTAGITIPAVDEALFTGARLYIDDVTGAIGTTEAPDTLASFDYKATTGLAHQFAANGSLGFSKAHRKGGVKITSTLTLYQNSVAMAEYDNWLAQKPRLVRIRIDGPTLASAGTVYSKKAIVLNLPGTWTKFPSPDEIEGAEVLAGQFRVAYDPTANVGPSITVVNELAALP